MKLSALQADTEYAVVIGWTSMNHNPYYNDLNNISRRDVTKATLVSTDKYQYVQDTRYNMSEDKGAFTLAPKNAKSNLGVLLRATDTGGVVRYFVSRISEVIVEWSALEPVWVAKEEAERLESLKRERLQQELNRKRDNARLHAERAQTNLPNTLKKLLVTLNGNVEVSYSSYSDNPSPTVTLSLRDIERLIELAFDNQEEVA
jgi:hypothetical protein